jgi:hypothetical protein
VACICLLSGFRDLTVCTCMQVQPEAQPEPQPDATRYLTRNKVGKVADVLLVCYVFNAQTLTSNLCYCR